jgi:polyadenylation factor subunit 2
VYDIRMMKEMASFKGHNKDVSCCAWHPIHEELFASGAYDGSLLYWVVGEDKPQAEVACNPSTALLSGNIPYNYLHFLSTNGCICSGFYWSFITHLTLS